MKAVSNAGSLIALGRLGQLGLFLELFVEVIFLALEESADWVLIDNAPSRKAARQTGLHPGGTIGLLLNAFEKGLLSLREFELLIHNIKAQPNLWISESLCDQALAKARLMTAS